MKKMMTNKNNNKISQTKMGSFLYRLFGRQQEQETPKIDPLVNLTHLDWSESDLSGLTHLDCSRCTSLTTIDTLPNLTVLDCSR